MRAIGKIERIAQKRSSLHLNLLSVLLLMTQSPPFLKILASAQRNGELLSQTTKTKEIDNLAIEIEQQIKENRIYLDNLPEFELGKRLRNSTLSVDDLLNAARGNG